MRPTVYSFAWVPVALLAGVSIPALAVAVIIAAPVRPVDAARVYGTTLGGRERHLQRVDRHRVEAPLLQIPHHLANLRLHVLHE